jgi:hypothetical protein
MTSMFTYRVFLCFFRLIVLMFRSYDRSTKKLQWTETRRSPLLGLRELYRESKNAHPFPVFLERFENADMFICSTYRMEFAVCLQHIVMQPSVLLISDHHILHIFL